MAKVLITAGATTTPIDEVRSITNVFTGTTGTNIARYFSNQGEDVSLITSNPGLLRPVKNPIRLITFTTYNELAVCMKDELTTIPYDIIIHSAAVSDYRVAGVFVKEPSGLVEIDSSGKVGSEHPEIFLKLVPTQKLVDQIREHWDFKGTLVKFKLQVGMSDEELRDISYKSMLHSGADFIVANCLEWFMERAFIINKNNVYWQTSREGLPELLHDLTRYFVHQ